MHSATILCEKGQYYWLWCACKRLIGPVCVVLKTRMLCKNAPTWPASEGEGRGKSLQTVFRVQHSRVSKLKCSSLSTCPRVEAKGSTWPCVFCASNVSPQGPSLFVSLRGSAPTSSKPSLHLLAYIISPCSSSSTVQWVSLCRTVWMFS